MPGISFIPLYREFMTPKRIFSCPKYHGRMDLLNRTENSMRASCKRFDLQGSTNFFHWSSMRSTARGGCQVFFVFMKKPVQMFRPGLKKTPRRRLIRFQGIQSRTFFLLIFTPLSSPVIDKMHNPSEPLKLMIPYVYYVLQLKAIQENQNETSLEKGSLYNPGRLYLACRKCWLGISKPVMKLVAEFFIHQNNGSKETGFVLKGTEHVHHKNVEVELKLQFYQVVQVIYL